MQIYPTFLDGAYTIELDKIKDDRGFFARLYCSKKFSDYKLINDIVQINNSKAIHKGTLRGLHYQVSPYEETKIIRCIHGSIFDVIVDLRENSKTFGKYFSEILSSKNRLMLYVPKGFAHGFITLEENTEVIYLTDEYYAPEFERGIRWNDPFFNIEWPINPTVISEKDRKLSDFAR